MSMLSLNSKPMSSVTFHLQLHLCLRFCQTWILATDPCCSILFHFWWFFSLDLHTTLDPLQNYLQLLKTHLPWPGQIYFASALAQRTQLCNAYEYLRIWTCRFAIDVVKSLSLFQVWALVGYIALMLGFHSLFWKDGDILFYIYFWTEILQCREEAWCSCL